MFTVIIPIDSIFFDFSNKANISALSEHELIEIIKKNYSFIPYPLDIKILDNHAIISLVDIPKSKVNKSKKIFKKAVHEAESKNYTNAIKLFSEVLDITPTDIDARRNLAMSYLESGNSKKAQTLLNECLKLNPSDTWSYVLLGNIFSKVERNYQAAEFYYEAGISVNPKDNLLLNNYAALQMEIGNLDKSKQLFEESLSINPFFPNAYYGLASVFYKQGNLHKTLSTIEQMFVHINADDAKKTSIYPLIKKLHLEVTLKIANDESRKNLTYTQEQIEKVEFEFGNRIEIIEDNTLIGISAVAKMKWKHGNDAHLIRYRNNDLLTIPHLITHELEHIILESNARQQNKNLFFATTDQTLKNALNSIPKIPSKLKKITSDEISIKSYLKELVTGLCSQIFNCPLDMIVEQNIYTKHPSIRSSQFISLRNLYLEYFSVLTNKHLLENVPRSIYVFSNTLNCAYSFFVDNMYSGLTDYSLSYKTFEGYNQGHDLFDIWKQKYKTLQPGQEYELVDDFAKYLKLDSWYTWKIDAATENKTLNFTPNIGNFYDSNPTLDTFSAEYLHCIDALRRFNSKSKNEILAIISEISTIGQSGIDYLSGNAYYDLSFYPGERFSGLHLLCLMFVGFKLYDPIINCGIDFTSAYEKALSTYNRTLN